jgi:hypothetical protein
LNPYNICGARRLAKNKTTLILILAVILFAIVLVATNLIYPMLYPPIAGRPPRAVVIIVVSGLQVESFQRYSFPVVDELKSNGVCLSGTSAQFGGDTWTAYVFPQVITATGYKTLHNLSYNVESRSPGAASFEKNVTLLPIPENIEEVFDVFHRHNYRVGVFIDDARARVLNAPKHSIDVLHSEQSPALYTRIIGDAKATDQRLVEAMCNFIKDQRDQNFVAFTVIEQVHTIGMISEKRSKGALSSDYQDAIKNVFENLIPQIVNTIKENRLWNNSLLGIVGDFGFRNNPERNRWTGKYNFHYNGQSDPTVNTVIWILAYPGGKLEQLLKVKPANFELTATITKICTGELPVQSNARVFFAIPEIQ